MLPDFLVVAAACRPNCHLHCSCLPLLFCKKQSKTHQDVSVGKLAPLVQKLDCAKYRENIEMPELLWWGFKISVHTSIPTWCWWRRLAKLVYKYILLSHLAFLVKAIQCAISDEHFSFGTRKQSVVLTVVVNHQRNNNKSPVLNSVRLHRTGSQK